MPPTVSLRDYLQELENLQRAGQYDEVIDHCKHILRFFPKNIATYRLLGNTLLARRNFAEAAEIFRRVLSASPYDYDVHMGLSLVAEQQNNLDAAIWYLERALEVTPNDSRVIQRIQTLYQKRDNRPPERIQMTRVGLAHQYMSAQLYDQAIAELRDGVERAPQRYDLKMLLAEALFEAQRYVEAGEIALDVLKFLPDFLPANKLMARLWLAQKRPEDAKPFIDRVEALSPYESVALVSGQEHVNPNAFVIQKLDWQATTLAAQSTATLDWMSDFGEGLTTEKGLVAADDWAEEASTPDWFTPGAEFAEPEVQQFEAPEDAADWFKSMGTAPLIPSEESLPEEVEFPEEQADLFAAMGSDEVAMPTTSDLAASFDESADIDNTLIAPLSERADEEMFLGGANEFAPPAWLPTPSDDEFGAGMSVRPEAKSIQTNWLQPPSELPFEGEEESEPLPEWMQVEEPETVQESTEFEGELEWLMSEEFNEQPSDWMSTPSPEEPAMPSQESPDLAGSTEESELEPSTQWLTADEAEPELAAPTDWLTGSDVDDADWLGGIEEIEPEMELDWLSTEEPAASEETPAEAAPDWLGSGVSESEA
ncbi:MAG: tetratricopeptide repeat protein, partial [Anaerolineae bacterium]|nr:tetratricopeptide repeat protein [Anaerolineae bacterium]